MVGKDFWEYKHVSSRKIFSVVFQQFDDICRDKGAFFISYRLANIVMTDKILVLEKGSVIESGSHKELINRKERYAYLFNLQAEKYRT
jgi:ATP-binding cassette subfamily B protein